MRDPELLTALLGKVAQDPKKQRALGTVLQAVQRVVARCAADGSDPLRAWVQVRIRAVRTPEAVEALTEECCHVSLGEHLVRSARWSSMDIVLDRLELPLALRQQAALAAQRQAGPRNSYMLEVLRDSTPQWRSAYLTSPEASADDARVAVDCAALSSGDLDQLLLLLADDWSHHGFTSMVVLLGIATHPAATPAQQQAAAARLLGPQAATARLLGPQANGFRDAIAGTVAQVVACVPVTDGGDLPLEAGALHIDGSVHVRALVNGYLHRALPRVTSPAAVSALIALACTSTFTGTVSELLDTASSIADALPATPATVA